MSITTTILQFATTDGAEAASEGGLLGSLGIDVQMLVLQIIGFVILVWAAGKFVFPILMKQVDARQEKIESSLKAAREAEKHAASADARIDEKLKQARAEAKEIVATAKEEATQLLDEADKKSKANAEMTLKKAHDEVAREVTAAKKALHNETLDLVALATERVIGATHTAKADKSVISDALKEAEK